ncbi:MAG: T9SS type A sorting domain-containing protein [Flavobacteriales bacterium]|nr:T9SS type A sorting domain-containing protein [Flavobacteriales bacterium]
MKAHFKQFRALALFLIIGTSGSATAQCISSFPYTEDFEKFSRIQEIEACNATILGDTANGWLQDQLDGGEWRADTAGSPSIGTGPGATDTTNGVGVGTDYNPGNTGGRYLYTEASSATGCANKEISLISPCFDLSGTSYYRIKLAYHMLGAGMGSLHIDVYDSNTWVKDVWKISGDQGAKWQVAIISLANFHRSVTRIRIRAVMGSNFLSDCAIDDFKIEAFNPPDVDLITLEVRNSSAGYLQIPFKQADSLRFWGKVKNEGVKTASNSRLVVEHASWKDSVRFGDLTSFEFDSGFVAGKFMPYKGMDNSFLFRVRSNASDADPSNDTMRMRTGYNDSIYARDDGASTGGLGFNGATGGQVGQMYELLRDDTLTSISFYIANPVAGDSVKVHLYEFGTTPGNRIASTSHVRLVAGVNWYTLRFPCDQALKKGKYFAAVQQLNLNNMSLGYSGKYYVPNSAFYNGGASWVELGSANFKVVMMVRFNLGKVKYPKVEINSPDSSCSGQQLTLSATGAKSYVWSSGGVIRDSTKATVQINPTNSFYVTLRGTDACGLTRQASKTIKVNRTPSGKVSADTTACVGDRITLRASGGSSYQWEGGPSNQNWNYEVKSSALVVVLIDSVNGCRRRLTTNITASSASVRASNDTSVCAGSLYQLSAQGANSYQWVNGPATAKWNIRPGSNSTYVVWGFNPLGCKAIDSVRIQTIAGPSVQISNDTAVCFGDRVLLKLSGGTSWQWKGGPTTQNWNVLPISTGYYFGTAKGSGACSTTDSVYIQVEKRPVLDLRNDTTICEGISLLLHARSADMPTYIWSTGATTDRITVQPASTTSYKVSAFNSIGCSTSDSVRISVNPLPRASFTYTLNARDITLSNKSQHATSYSWDFDDGSGSSDQNPFHRYKIDGNYNVKLTVTNACGTDDTTVLIEVLNLSVHDEWSDLLHIFPNPADRRVQILPGDEQLELRSVNLIDAMGRFVSVPMTTQIGVDRVLDLSAVHPGMYLLQVETPRGTILRKLSVVH